MRSFRGFIDLSKDHKAVLLRDQRVDLQARPKTGIPHLTYCCVLCDERIARGETYRKWDNSSPAHLACINMIAHGKSLTEACFEDGKVVAVERKKRKPVMPMPDKIIDIIRTSPECTKRDIACWFSNKKWPQVSAHLADMVARGVVFQETVKRQNISCTTYRINELAQFTDEETELKALRKEVLLLRAFKRKIEEAFMEAP